MAGFKYFVETADTASAALKEIEEEKLKELEFFREQMRTNNARNASTSARVETGLKLLSAGQAYTWTVAGSFLTEGMVIDVLRIGEGWDKGAWGKTQDALRALAIVGPVVGAVRGIGAAIPAIRELQGLAKAIDFNSKLGMCGWVAAARALRLSGQRIFITVQDLARAKGLSALTAETAGIDNLQLYAEIFRKLNIDALMMKLPKYGKMLGSRSLETTTLAELEKGVRAARGDVVMFTVWNYEGVEIGGHTVCAREVAGKIQYIERTGDIFDRIQDLPSMLSRGYDLTNIFPDVNYIVINNASIVPTAGTIAAITPNFLNVIAVRVLPTVIRPTTKTTP